MQDQVDVPKYLENYRGQRRAVKGNVGIGDQTKAGYQLV
jgi:hypothetical protein